MDILELCIVLSHPQLLVQLKGIPSLKAPSVQHLFASPMLLWAFLRSLHCNSWVSRWGYRRYLMLSPDFREGRAVLLLWCDHAVTWSSSRGCSSLSLSLSPRGSVQDQKHNQCPPFRVPRASWLLFPKTSFRPRTPLLQAHTGIWAPSASDKY